MLYTRLYYDHDYTYSRKEKKDVELMCNLPVNLVRLDLHLYLKLLLLRLFHQIPDISPQMSMLLSLFWAKVHAQENLDQPRQPFLKFDLFSLQCHPMFLERTRKPDQTTVKNTMSRFLCGGAG